MLPAGTVDVVKRLQGEGHVGAMLGDGVNDAAALAQSDPGRRPAPGRHPVTHGAHALRMTMPSPDQMSGFFPDARCAIHWCSRDMATMLMRALDAAFGHPRGLAGRLGGAMMARGNAEQEQWAVRHTQLRPATRVLVVGHGPGVGLAFAAATVGSGGHVVGVDPSATMREMAAARCAPQITAGQLELRDGTAEHTGCAEASIDAVISVNNVMLWDRPAGFAELHRVLRPGGRLVITVHRHVLGIPPDQLHAEASAAGFVNLTFTLRDRRLNSPAVELLAQRPAA